VKHSLKKIPHSQVLITIEVETSELEKFRGKALDKLREQVKIAGFRPGKAPDNVVIEQVGDAAIEEEILRSALPELYYEAVVKEKLQPISAPESKVISKSPLKVEFTISLLPEISLGNYKKIKVKPKTVSVEEKEVDEELESLKKRFATYHEVKASAQMEHRVEISFTGMMEGKEVPGAKSKNHPMVLGAKTFVPGFEEAIVGMEMGQKKQFNVTFPSDYHAEQLKGKEVTFDVELHRIEETRLPEMNAEFFTRLKNEKITDLPSLKAEIKAYLLATKETQEKARQEDEILQALVKITKVELPHVLIHDEIHYMEGSFAERLQGMGMTFERYLEANKKTHEDIHKDWEPEATRRLTARFALLELAKKENLEPTDEEVKAALQQEKVEEKDYSRYEGQIKARIRVERGLDWLMRSALE